MPDINKQLGNYLAMQQQAAAQKAAFLARTPAALPSLFPAPPLPTQRQTQPVSITQPQQNRGAITVPMVGPDGINPIQTMPATGSNPLAAIQALLASAQK